MGGSMRPKMLFIILWLCIGGKQAMGQENQSVPHGILGIWSGTSGSPSGTSWDIILTVAGGSDDGPLGVFERWYSGNSCLYTIGADPPKKGRKTKQDPGIFKAKTLTASSLTSSKCRKGKLSINYLQSNRLLIDASWENINDSGDVAEWTFVLNRLDSGKTGERMEKCKPAGSPLTRLKKAVNNG